MKTQPLNEMKLVFPSSSANESFARAAVSAFAAQLDPTVDELSDITATPSAKLPLRSACLKEGG